MRNWAAEATELCRQSILADSTGDGAPMSPLYFYTTPEQSDDMLDQYVLAGFSWVSFTAAADRHMSIEAAVKSIAASRNYFLRRPDRFILVDTMADILRAKAEGKLAVNFHFQGTNPALGDLNMLETYRRLGVGHMLIAYNERNYAGDGCHEKSDAGLSRYGKSLVEEMNRVHIMVDVTHTGYRTSMDVFEVSEKPVILSHSNPRALCDHDRNVRDDQIQACAKSGGVMGINGIGIFMSAAGDDVSPAMFVRHIDYVAQLVGVRHVGLGIDYVHDTESLKAMVRTNSSRYTGDSRYFSKEVVLSHPAVIEGIAEGLLRMNYVEGDVANVLGGNWVRVFREIWG